MRAFFALLLCLLPLGALAQSAKSADVKALQSCVENYATSSPASRTTGACVGILGARCKDTATTVGLAECIMREHAAWDVLLNAWWKPMKQRAQGNGTWDRLLASQRKWIKDRDAECKRAYDSAGGGSIRVIYGAECQRDLTAQKAIEFYYSLYR